MKNLNKNAYAVVEYVVLFIIIVSAFLVMRHFMQNGINGNWGKTGQSIAYGRQYDSQRTIECSYDMQSNLWYDRYCYDSMTQQKCSGGDTACQESIITGTCQMSSCNEANNKQTAEF